MPKAIGQITIRDENDISISSTAPIKPIKDQMWLDTSKNPSVLKRYNGGSWDVVNDYTGIIEDVEEKIEANTTSISVVQGQISGIIAESAITKGDIITLKDNYTSVKATVDGLSTTVASHTSSIGKLTTDLSGISGKVTTVETKQATLEQNLNGFKTTVSNTYSTKTELNTAKIDAINSANNSTDNKLKNYSTTIAMNTAITQSANSVKTEVSNTYLSKGDATNTYATKASMELTSTQLRLDFSNSGGYNIVMNGGFKNGGIGWGLGEHIPNGAGKTYAILDDTNEWVLDGTYALCMRSTNNTTGEFRVDSQKFKVKRNTTYTLSYLVAAHRVTRIGHYIRGNEWGIIESREYKPNSGGKNRNDWTRIIHTFNTGDNYQVSLNFIHFQTGNDAYSWVTDVMINEGEIALPWSPHPDEVYSGNTIIDASGVIIKNGAINVQNNIGSNVLTGDSNGNLVMKGVFEQYATNTGYKSIGISNNNVNIYDYTRDGDLVGRLGSGTSLLNGRGMVSLNSDAGNILSLGYQTTSTSGVGVFEIDDTKTNFGGIARSGFFENYSMVNYSMINFTGNDKSIALGRVGLSTSNSVYLLGNDAYSSVNIGLFSNSNIGSFNSKAKITNDGLMVFGNINCSGTKNRIILTNNFDGVKLNAYETADCYFGDIGEGKIGEDGLCYIYLDPVLLETVNTKCNYQVFLSNYGVEENDWCGCIMREKDYFIVKGTPGLKFGWEIKAKQRGYETDRLEREFIEIPEEVEKLEEERNEIDELAYEYLIEYEKELIEIG